MYFFAEKVFLFSVSGLTITLKLAWKEEKNFRSQEVTYCPTCIICKIKDPNPHPPCESHKKRLMVKEWISIWVLQLRRPLWSQQIFPLVKDVLKQMASNIFSYQKSWLLINISYSSIWWNLSLFKYSSYFSMSWLHVNNSIKNKTKNAIKEILFQC